MRILVVSDSHGITRELENLLDYYRDDVDIILHCGDSELMGIDTIWHLVDGVVKGNVDFDPTFETEWIQQLKDMSIFMTHGHLYRVNYTREELARAAKDKGCRIALYGHTHVLSHEMINDVLCINPGSFNHSRGPVDERTYMLLSLEEQQVHIRYYKHDHTPLSHLDATYVIGE